MEAAATRSYGLDTVNVSVSGKTGEGKGLPLIISPRWDPSLEFLVQWCKVNQGWLDQQLVQYGAILVRGFEIETASHLEKAIQACHADLNDTYRGTSPRQLIEGTKFVFSAADVPVNYPIAQHIEMSFLPKPPRFLYFGCLKAPVTAGGETALADFRQIFKALSPTLRQKLIDKGIRYVRTHKKVGSYFTFDVASMLSWPQLFDTDDMEEVEAICKQEMIPCEWHGDTYVSTFRTEAFQLHPVTKEPVWFNHTQVFHWTTFPAELWFAWRRTHEFRLLLHCLLVAVFCVIKYGILGYKMSLHCDFGDGEPISILEMHEIRCAIHDNMVFSRWQKGDLMLIDNFSTSHGRQPTYDKGRKVVVAWADPLEKANELTFAYTGDLTAFAKDKIMAGNNPDHVGNHIEIKNPHLDNPQDRSPQTTLSTQESMTLKEKLFVTRLRNVLLSSELGVENPQNSTLSDATIEALKLVIDEAERKKHRKSFSNPSTVHIYLSS